jgi:trans-aconitate 2-methyltransferase
MSIWNARHYLKYGEERTRAASDLAARVKLTRPGRIVDLGCGPGNSTQVLRQRWPMADIVGVDSSSEMIDAARREFPEQNWIQENISHWSPGEPFDLIYSNATLQWLPDHHALMRRLLSLVVPGGALAFQIPSGNFATVRTLIHEISHESAWTDRMDAARHALTMESPAFYYDTLTEFASKLDIWETEYHHILESQKSVVDWIASTGLRPFLAALDSEEERELFLAKLRHRVNDAYPLQIDGRVLFPFRRTFVIAYRRLV